MLEPVAKNQLSFRIAGLFQDGRGVVVGTEAVVVLLSIERVVSLTRLLSEDRRKSLEEIHCVELEPAMIEANRYWGPFIGNILNDARVKMHATDGRTYVLGSPRKFDNTIHLTASKMAETL